MVRRPYRTKCRFFRDSDVECDVHWYIVPAENGTLGVPCRINSLDWRDNRMNPGVIGEVSFADRPFDGWGRIVPPTPGDHLCGSPEDFREGGRYLPDDPPFPRADDGIPFCCRPPLGALLVGGPTWFADVWTAGPNGVAVGGQSFGVSSFLTITPELFPEIPTGEWVIAAVPAQIEGWCWFASEVGDRWAIEWVGNTGTPSWSAGYPRVIPYANAFDPPLPWDVLTDTYGEFTHTSDPYGTGGIWLGMFRDDLASAVGYRVTRLGP